MRTNELMLYRNMEHGRILEDFTYLMEYSTSAAEVREEMKTLLYSDLCELLSLASSYGFEGSLWHSYLTFLMANDENPFSMACEITGDPGGSVSQIAAHDFEIIKEWIDFPLEKIERSIGAEFVPMICSYRNVNERSKMFNKRIRERIGTLTQALEESESVEAFQQAVTQFYKEYGVGKLGLHKAFRIEHKTEDVKIVPITKIAHVQLDDLIGYEIPKQKLIENTEAFVAGRKANNCLLFGAAGTGKSSSIKAILNQYYDQGLRMIEVYKHQFQDLNDVIAQIKNRNYKFIIYMDDLSFEEFEIEYKYLKAVIEGGLEKKPDNVLIYATSNRRHLVRETFNDRSDDIHTTDTIQEKLSLVARFGVSIFFDSPEKKEFQQIVRELAKKNRIDIPEKELLLEANKWELAHGGLSGRTAQQFIDFLLGRQ